jgi:hypothetical protein
MLKPYKKYNLNYKFNKNFNDILYKYPLEC